MRKSFAASALSPSAILVAGSTAAGAAGFASVVPWTMVRAGDAAASGAGGVGGELEGEVGVGRERGVAAIRFGRVGELLRRPLRESEVVPGRGVLRLQAHGAAEMPDRLGHLPAAEEDLPDLVMGDLVVRVRLDCEPEVLQRLVLAARGHRGEAPLTHLRRARSLRRSGIAGRLLRRRTDRTRGQRQCAPGVYES